MQVIRLEYCWILLEFKLHKSGRLCLNSIKSKYKHSYVFNFLKNMITTLIIVYIFIYVI